MIPAYETSAQPMKCYTENDEPQPQVVDALGLDLHDEQRHDYCSTEQQAIATTRCRVTADILWAIAAPINTPEATPIPIGTASIQSTLPCRTWPSVANGEIITCTAIPSPTATKIG